MPRVSISWEAVSVCCSHAAREMVVPGKDLKGGLCGPTSALAEGSQVLEHNTCRAKFEPQHLLLGKVLGEQSQDILMTKSDSLHNSSNFIIQPAGETFQKLWKGPSLSVCHLLK